MATHQVIVVGGGVAGLAVSTFLARQGHDVTLLEQAEAITEVGAGLQISPNGLAVLRALGLDDDIAKRSVRARAVSLRDYRRGAQVFRLNLDQGATDNAYYFVHRADLIDVLGAAARDAGVKIRLLQQVVGVRDGAPVTLEMANGATIKGDLVIGADGLHSKLREALNGVTAPFFTRQVAWRAVVPNLSGHPPHARVHMGPGRHLVSYPLRDGHSVNIVAVQERGEWAEEGWNTRDNPDALRAAFADFDAEVHHLLAGVDDVYLWGLFRHPVARKWHGQGIAILGDAAHPTLPFMAQGANMALEDAWMLAACLERIADRAMALETYQAMRVNRTRKIVETANGNAWKYHLSFPPLRFAAHSVMRLMSMAAPKRMQKQFDWIYGYDVTREVIQPQASSSTQTGT